VKNITHGFGLDDFISNSIKNFMRNIPSVAQSIAIPLITTMPQIHILPIKMIYGGSYEIK